MCHAELANPPERARTCWRQYDTSLPVCVSVIPAFQSVGDVTFWPSPHPPTHLCRDERLTTFLGKCWVVKASVHPMPCPATDSSHSAMQFLRRPVCGHMCIHILSRTRMGQSKGSHTLRPPPIPSASLQCSLCFCYSQVLLCGPHRICFSARL